MDPRNLPTAAADMSGRDALAAAAAEGLTGEAAKRIAAAKNVVDRLEAITPPLPETDGRAMIDRLASALLADPDVDIAPAIAQETAAWDRSWILRAAHREALSLARGTLAAQVRAVSSEAWEQFTQGARKAARDYADVLGDEPYPDESQALRAGGSQRSRLLKLEAAEAALQDVGAAFTAMRLLMGNGHDETVTHLDAYFSRRAVDDRGVPLTWERVRWMQRTERLTILAFAARYGLVESIRLGSAKEQLLRAERDAQEDRDRRSGVSLRGATDVTVPGGDLTEAQMVEASGLAVSGRRR